MKRLLLIILLLLCLVITSHAESYYLRAFSYAQRLNNNDWTEWERINILIIIDVTNTIIELKGNPSIYIKMLEIIEPFYDDNGGYQLGFNCIDDSLSSCYVRLRCQDDNQLQLYLDYSTFNIVFNVEQLR